MTDTPQDQTQAYEGVHRELFEVSLELADDGEAQTRALLELAPWEGVRSLLSVGGGEGLVEAELLRHAPEADIWYLDPSPEQAAAFRAHLDARGLSSRVRGVAQSTFQEFATPHRFDRIVYGATRLPTSNPAIKRRRVAGVAGAAGESAIALSVMQHP